MRGETRLPALVIADVLLFPTGGASQDRCAIQIFRSQRRSRVLCRLTASHVMLVSQRALRKIDPPESFEDLETASANNGY